MNHAEFSVRFPESTQIGYDLTENEACYDFDNGRDVGIWRVNRRTTCGQAEILDIENSHIARHYYRKEQKQAAAADRAC